MKNKTNIIVVCNNIKEYIECQEKSLRIFNIKQDNDIQMIKDELKMYKLPILLIIEKNFDNTNIDWCVDKECKGCACLSQCTINNKLTSEDFLTNYRKKKLKRILNV